MRIVAQRLLVAEATNRNSADAHLHEAVRVCEKLRIVMVRLIGLDGYAALLRRALALARTEVPELERVTVGSDCCMHGLEDLATDTTSGGIHGPTVVTAHLLGLLATFLGEPLTLQLVRDCWPAATLDDKP